MKEQCPHCELLQQKVPYTIFENEHTVAMLHTNPVIPGHTVVIPKKHFTVLGLYPDNQMEVLVDAISQVSTYLFEKMSITGTNVLIRNGVPAGQEMPHLVADIIPRKENDGLSFSWTPKEVTAEEMASVLASLKGSSESASPKEEGVVIDMIPSEPVIPPSENYLYRQLERIP